MAAFFKKIYSRKVTAFFLLHFTFLGMYFIEPSDALIWAILGNALGFISLNSLDKFMIRRIEYVKATKE